MGIIGLKRLLEKFNLLKKLELQKQVESRTLLIDGSCLSATLHNPKSTTNLMKSIPSYFGAQWIDFFENVQLFVKKFHELNIELVFIFDGIYEDIKQETAKGRRLINQENICIALEKIRGGIIPTLDVPPTGWRSVLQSMLKSLNITTIQAPMEADNFIVNYCRNNKIWAILANDYDFCVLPQINLFLDINSFDFEEMTVNCVDRIQQLKTFGISQEQLEIFGCVLGKDFCTEDDRKKMASYIKKHVTPRNYYFEVNGKRDRAQEDINWAETVIDWLVSKKDSPPQDLIIELSKVFPGILNVHEKFSKFEIPQIENFIIDRLSFGGLYIPKDLIEDYFRGNLTTSDISFFVNDTGCLAKGLEDETIFGISHVDVQNIFLRIKLGILFPPEKRENLPDIEHAQNIVDKLSELASLSSISNTRRPTWQKLAREFAKNLIEDFKDPIFVYVSVEDGIPEKIFPVRLLDSNDKIIQVYGTTSTTNNSNNNSDNSNNISNNNTNINDSTNTTTTATITSTNNFFFEKKLFILCSLTASPKFINPDIKSLKINSVEDHFGNHVKTLLNMDITDVVFCLTVVFMLNNGLNKKLYVREFDGLILQYLTLKTKTSMAKFLPPPISIRSITLYNIFSSAYNSQIILCRFFRIPFDPNQPSWYFLHGQVFHHFLTANNNIDQRFLSQFNSLKSMIFSLVEFEPSPVAEEYIIPTKLKEEESIKCRYLQERGFCNFGERCKFSHEGIAPIEFGSSFSPPNITGPVYFPVPFVDDWSPPQRYEKAPPCKFFAVGKCLKGLFCNFSHEIAPTTSPDASWIREGFDSKQQ